MFKSSNTIGIEKKKMAKNKKIILILFLVLIFSLCVFILFITNGFSKLMGNSAVSYYCSDSSYTLNGNKCIKKLEEKPILLGDINNDNSITDEDLKLLSQYVDFILYEEDNGISFTNLQIKATDINEDGETGYTDISILDEFLNKNISTNNSYFENIGVKKICSDNYKLSNGMCIKEDIKDAQANSGEAGSNNSSMGDAVDIILSEKENNSKTIDANVKINDNKSYYYRFKTYKYDTVDYYSKCTKLTNGVMTNKLKENIGRTKGAYEIYNDALCTKKIKEVETDEYFDDIIYNKYYQPESIIYPVQISIENIKSETTDIFDKKVKVNNNIKNTEYFPYNTKVQVKLNFKVYDQSKQYYYRWIRAYPRYGYMAQSGCYPIPKSGYVYKTFSVNDGLDNRYYLLPPTKNDSEFKKFGVGGPRIKLIVYDTPYCGTRKNELVYSVFKKYSLQYFIVKYDANGGIIDFPSVEGQGRFQTTASEFAVYNRDNRLFVEPYHNYGFRDPAATLMISRKGYDLIGYRVKNSKGQFICYKNANKSSSGFTDESYCKNYGYVIYKNTDRLSKTTNVNGEVLTFIAQWTNKPVTVNVSKLGTTKLGKGTQVTTTISFKVNDKENQYYYSWGYKKMDNVNHSDVNNYTKDVFGILFAGSPNGSYSKSFYDDIKKEWHLDSCRKITDGLVFKPTLTVEKAVNAGIIAVYKDSNCKYLIDSISNVYKATETFFCKNIDEGTCKK